MMGTRVILTYKDYEALPADGRRYELHEGELSVTPAPSPKHQETGGNLLIVLSQHVKARGLGKVFVSPIDCILSDITVVQPDLVYVETGRLSAITTRGIEGPPTLVIEILSPSTIQIDRGVKVQLYARHGVPYYWIVDPEARSIEAYQLREGGYRLTARFEGTDPVFLPPFPDLALVAASIWP
ncbi:MAG: Uma2 family endonuclease [Candidatus Rokubacteria bacterium]|nr:Uma2 family endonuclease [Candidatus Rokubacteria bacterium]